MPNASQHELLLNALVDGQLSGRDREKALQLIASDRKHADYVNELKSQRAQFRQLESHTLPSGFARRVLNQATIENASSGVNESGRDRRESELRDSAFSDSTSRLDYRETLGDNGSQSAKHQTHKQNSSRRNSSRFAIAAIGSLAAMLLLTLTLSHPENVAELSGRSASEAALSDEGDSAGGLAESAPTSDVPVDSPAEIHDGSMSFKGDPGSVDGAPAGGSDNKDHEFDDDFDWAPGAGVANGMDRTNEIGNLASKSGVMDDRPGESFDEAMAAGSEIGLDDTGFEAGVPDAIGSLESDSQRVDRDQILADSFADNIRASGNGPSAMNPAPQLDAALQDVVQGGADANLEKLVPPGNQAVAGSIQSDANAQRAEQIAIAQEIEGRNVDEVLFVSVSNRRQLLEIQNVFNQNNILLILGQTANAGSGYRGQPAQSDDSGLDLLRDSFEAVYVKATSRQMQNVLAMLPADIVTFRVPSESGMQLEMQSARANRDQGMQTNADPLTGNESAHHQSKGMAPSVNDMSSGGMGAGGGGRRVLEHQAYGHSVPSNLVLPRGSTAADRQKEASKLGLGSLLQRPATLAEKKGGQEESVNNEENIDKVDGFEGSLRAENVQQEAEESVDAPILRRGADGMTDEVKMSQEMIDEEMSDQDDRPQSFFLVFQITDEGTSGEAGRAVPIEMFNDSFDSDNVAEPADR